jgi:Flp pilus assembly pilin Flp
MVKEFLLDEEGQSVVEYSLLLTLIGASAVFMLTLMGISIGRMIGVNDVSFERYTEWAYEKFKSK